MNIQCLYFFTLGILCRGKWLVVSFVFILLMTGCVVKSNTSYYLPAAPGGTVVRAMEPRTNSVMLFEQEGIIIGVNTVKNYKDQLYVSISFEIPDGKVVQLLEHNIEVSVSAKDIRKSELSGMIWAGPGRTKDFPVDMLMIGRSEGWSFGTGKGYGQTKYAAFFFTTLLFTAPGVKTFEIEMPRFLVNNTEIVLPLIKFTLDSEDLWISLP